MDPSIKKGPWTEEEERILIEAQQKFGNKWSVIARLLPGRTDNTIKNHFNSIVYHKNKGTKPTVKKPKKCRETLKKKEHRRSLSDTVFYNVLHHRTDTTTKPKRNIQEQVGIKQPTTAQQTTAVQQQTTVQQQQQQMSTPQMMNLLQQPQQFIPQQQFIQFPPQQQLQMPFNAMMPIAGGQEHTSFTSMLQQPVNEPNLNQLELNQQTNITQQMDTTQSNITQENVIHNDQQSSSNNVQTFDVDNLLLSDGISLVVSTDSLTDMTQWPKFDLNLPYMDNLIKDEPVDLFDSMDLSDVRNRLIIMVLTDD